MKNSMKLLIILGFVLAVAFSGCLGNDENGDESDPAKLDGFYRNMTLTDDNKSVSFELTTNPSTGYGWTVSSDEPGILNESGNSVITPEMPGAPGVHKFKFDALKSGMTTLNFKYERHFEEGTTIENLTYVLSVTPENTIEIVSVSSNNDVLFFQNLITKDESKTIQMILKGNPSTGYNWDMKSSGKILNAVKDGILLPEESDEEPMSGAPGFFVWEFTGLKKGNETLTFDYHRSFEENSIVEKGVYNFSVDDNQVIAIRSVSLISAD